MPTGKIVFDQTKIRRTRDVPSDKFAREDRRAAPATLRLKCHAKGRSWAAAAHLQMPSRQFSRTVQPPTATVNVVCRKDESHGTEGNKPIDPIFQM